ncbi:GTP cyclohydrolase 1 type 2/Nif3 [Dipodascopsis uninucleata]
MSRQVLNQSAMRIVKNLVSTEYVVSVQQLYPKSLADSSWDNTGLLLESPIHDYHLSGNKIGVLLAIDLVAAVADEAIRKNVQLVVAYHPIIFRGLKSITLDNSQQRSLLRLAQAGISVYSPHTAVDAQIGGMNDWLADIASGKRYAESKVIIATSPESTNTGFGRYIKLEGEGLSLQTIISNIKKGLKLDYVQVAIADRHKDVEDSIIKSIAICAGSGASVLQKEEADLWFTGELSHHEVLAVRERGISAVICGHTNTERGYLSEVLQPKLTAQILVNKNNSCVDTYEDYDIEVMVSEEDKDPLTLF